MRSSRLPDRLFGAVLIAALLGWCCATPSRPCDEPCRLRGFASGEQGGPPGRRVCLCASAPQRAP